MNDFLKEFKKFKINENEYFFEDEIVGSFSGVGENFKNCTFLGINGDKLKDNNYTKYYKSKPKSCDVIKFLKDQIDFIEFKTLYIGDIKIINTQINEFKLTKKLEGSYYLLKKINEEANFNYENKSELIKTINKQFYISIYLHGFDSINRFIVAKNIKKIERNLDGYFKNHPMPFDENFLEPIFKKTENINSIY